MTRELSLTAQAYIQLRSDILACRLRPGAKLIISDICAKLGFSLGAVREALARLTSEGLVEAERNKGFRVAPITQAELEDITQTRMLIECECLSSAIAQGDERWEAGIVSTLSRLSMLNLQSRDSSGRMSDEWSDTHRRFHEALVAACGSPWLLRLRNILYVQSERYRSVSVPLGRAKRDIAAEHRAIADATMARDVRTACDAMRAHLALTTRILIDADVANGTSGVEPPLTPN